MSSFALIYYIEDVIRIVHGAALLYTPLNF